MIVQIRGTSGSGKSTAMREIMRGLGEWEPVYSSGRKKPLYYRRPEAVVLGHYESPCGGCDTIGSARQVYDLAATLQVVNSGRAILCEGLLLSEDVKWSKQMPGLRVVFITTPVEECIERIKARRADAGNDRPLNESNTRNRVAVIERARIKLMEAGVECRRASSAQASRIVLRWLRDLGYSR